MARRRANYRPAEVRQLVEEYPAYRELVDTNRRGLRYLVLTADLTGAFRKLPRKHWEVVLVHGLLGVPQVEAAQALHISLREVSKRYRQGLEHLVYVMNGEQDD